MAGVRDNPAQSRYELETDAGTAFIDYRCSGGVRILTHAEVPAQLRGSGVGAQLTAGALELVRSQGEKVVAHCAYVAYFIARHPQYQDLLADG
jgi:predicted GNAT family acetyltransferase